MKILITGGLGYIGSHIAAQLKNETIIIDNLSNSSLDYKRKLPLSIVYKLDLSYKNLKQIFSKHKIGGVIHLAGLKAVNESTKFPLKYYRNNFNSTLELLECMKNYNIQKLIFSSSATVYGNSHKSPIKEDFSLDSINPYASSKIIIEQMIKDYCSSNRNFKAISLRYFNPLGSDLTSGLADQPLGNPQNIMPILVRAVKNKKNFKIFGNDYDTKDGTCIRDYIHVKDLAYAHLLALKKLSSTKLYTAINLGMGKGISVLEFIKIFEKANKVKIKYSFSERRKGDVDISYANNQKAKDLLNWRPKYNYEDMMIDSWQSYLANF
tara:strand:+ start:22721 stop:23689 length:969 start_codon:yes stop_codon:yes gene_type:complete